MERHTIDTATVMTTSDTIRIGRSELVTRYSVLVEDLDGYLWELDHRFGTTDEAASVAEKLEMYGTIAPELWTMIERPEALVPFGARYHAALV